MVFEGKEYVYQGRFLPSGSLSGVRYILGRELSHIQHITVTLNAHIFQIRAQLVITVRILQGIAKILYARNVYTTVNPHQTIFAILQMTPTFNLRYQTQVPVQNISVCSSLRLCYIRIMLKDFLNKFKLKIRCQDPRETFTVSFFAIKLETNSDFAVVIR